MSSRPPLLPEEKNKRSTQPSRRVRPADMYPPATVRDLARKMRRRTSLLIISIIAILLISLGWIVTLTLIAYRPDLIGYDQVRDMDATAAVFQQTAVVLGDTGQLLDSRAIDLNATAQSVAVGGIANVETQTALEDREATFDQSATQTMLDTAATQTGVAVENARQSTQAAVEFASTQAAFDRQATQAEIDFQGTQAAINREATAVAMNFATAPPEVAPTFAPIPSPLFNEGFVTSGLDSGRWNLSEFTDWELADDGSIVAQRSGAWLLTQRDDLTDYGFIVDFEPLPGSSQAAFYYVPLNATIGEDRGVTVELFYDGTQISAVGLYTLEGAVFDGPFWEASLPEIETQFISVVPEDGFVTVQVEVRGERVTVYLEGQAVLDVFLAETLPQGAVGVSLPEGTRVERLALLP